LGEIAGAPANHSMRLFVGIPLASAVIDELSRTAKRLRLDGDGLRWTAPESWHITLQFLGNTSQEQFKCLVQQLRTLHLPSVPIGFEGLSCFDRSGVFFAGVRVSPELLLVHEHVTAVTALCGFASELRPYQPHVTLARSKDRDRRSSHGELKTAITHQPAFTRFVAKEFLLYESFLGSGGSRYEVRERFSLGAS
jgi:2'-5' RNA ligase